MKTTKLFQCLLFSFFLIMSSSVLQAQVCGNVTLTTQDDVNNFKCTSINGSLIINDGNTGKITSLLPLVQNGLANGASVSGNVQVLNCPALTTLEGLEGIKNIDGSLIVQNCQNLNSIGGFSFGLTTVKEVILLQECPQLKDIDALSKLVEVNGILFRGKLNLSDFSATDGLEVCNAVEFFQTNITKVNGFNNIKSTSLISFNENPNLEVITGFNSLSNIRQGTVLATQYNAFQLFDNASLVDVNTFENLEDLEGTDVIISNNIRLSACCFATTMLGANVGSISVSNNDGDCSSANAINAPPNLGSCPSPVNVNTEPGSCDGSFTLVHPSVSDNCDFQSLRIRATSQTTSAVDNFNITGSSSNVFIFPSDSYTLEYIARDQNGNTTTCTTTVQVNDNQNPTISNVPADVTINCDDDFPMIPSPVFADNCDPNLQLTAGSSISIGNCQLGEAAEIQDYSWTATDASGNSTTANWKVTVISDFSFELGPPVTACSGSSYTISSGVNGASYIWSTGATTSSLAVSSSGTYSVTITTDNGCCYADEVQVNFENQPSASATGATLACGTTSVQLTGSSTTSGVTYSWTGPGGFTSTQQNPMVTSAGEYTLTVSTPGGCTATATAMVSADTDLPVATAQGGALSCSIPSVQLMASSSTSGVTYSWSGPGGFTSSMQNPTVSAAGIYTVVVTGTNGCSTSIDVQVEADNSLPSIDLNDGELTCEISQVSYTQEGNVSWDGPGGFSSTSNSVVLTTPGTYGVTVTASNGCSASESFEIIQEVDPPNVNASGGMITCNSSGTTLIGSSTTTGASFSWTGPNGFTANVASPSVVSLGTYILTVEGPNGCTASASVEVTSGEDAPILEASDGFISCSETSAVLSVSASQQNLTYMWTGPNSFEASGASVSVNAPGVYTVVGTNQDGCSGSTTVEVVGDIEAPSISIFAPTLNCQEESSVFTVESDDVLTTYMWTGPDGFVSNMPNPSVTLEGTYYLTAVAENGCFAMDSFALDSDINSPDAIGQGGMLTCTENTLTLMGSSTTPDVSYQWTGPDGYFSNLQNPVVSVTGEYVLNVVALNGCTATDTVVVSGDADLPSISAIGGTLNCINESVMLIGSTQSENVEVQWEGPNGFFSSNPTPVVDIPGEYTFTVSSASGCKVFSRVEVLIDIRIPDLLLSFGSVNCNGRFGRFSVSTNAPDATFTWEGPNGFTSDDLNASYTEAGTYSLTLIDDNGCSSEGIIEVEHDIAFETDLQISGNTATLSIIGGTPPFDVVFNNTIQGTTATNLSNGENFLTIEDGLGCEEVIQFTINTTSVSDLEEEIELVLSPNPVNDRLNVTWKSYQGRFHKAQIIDIHGRLFTDIPITSNEIQIHEVGNLMPGVYFLQMTGEHEMVTKKFVKQ